MTEQDRERWNGRYTNGDPPPAEAVRLPAAFRPYVDMFPTRGWALDLACGQGAASVWLAQRGLVVHGVDISEVALGHARDLAQRKGVDVRCRFERLDLDGGLPPGQPADLILCHKFRDSRLDSEIVARLAPGGLLAMCVCSEVGVQPGPFRAAPGELLQAFSGLDPIEAGECDGAAWLLARNRYRYGVQRS